MKIQIQRLWHGVASPRSTEVARAKAKKEDLEIYCEKENASMTVAFKDLDKGQPERQLFRSKHNGEYYHLVNYKWSPDTHQKALL